MPQSIFKDAKERMEKTINNLNGQFSKVRTGRANPSILDRVEVEYYGMPTPLIQLATVSIPEARQLLIKPFDKNVLGNIEQAIYKADLGITPNNDGEVIRLNFPALTEERRKELVKEVKKIAESEKVAIRNIRRDANDHLKKLGLTEDDEKGWLEDVQEATNDFIKKIDELEKAKEKEVLTV